jgi:hypothetical protein
MCNFHILRAEMTNLLTDKKKSKLANEKGRKTALAIKPTAQQTHF